MLLYLIHFELRYHHARHYLGITADLDRRLGLHRSGQGAKLLRAVNETGIGWQVERASASSLDGLLRYRCFLLVLAPELLACVGGEHDTEEDQ